MKFNLSVELPDDCISPEDILNMFGDDAEGVEVIIPDNIDVTADENDIRIDIHQDSNADMYPFAYGNVIRIVQKIISIFNEDLEEAVYPNKMLIPYFTKVMNGEVTPTIGTKIVFNDFNYGAWSNDRYYSECKHEPTHMILDILLPKKLDVRKYMDTVAKHFPEYFDTYEQDRMIRGFITENAFSYTPEILYKLCPTDESNDQALEKTIGFAQRIIDMLYNIMKQEEDINHE